MGSRRGHFAALRGLFNPSAAPSLRYNLSQLIEACLSDREINLDLPQSALAPLYGTLALAPTSRARCPSRMTPPASKLDDGRKDLMEIPQIWPHDMMERTSVGTTEGRRATLPQMRFDQVSVVYVLLGTACIA